MASSRWKRFAFFERSTLSLASEVLEDLIPIGGSEGRGSRRSVGTLNRAADEASNDTVSLQITTAALPLNSKPVDKGQAKNPDDNALSSMWSSLTACTPSELPGTESGAIHLPSQAQMLEDDTNVTSSGTALDGLALVFVASQDTDRVHCFDVTVRCNPSKSSDKDLEDLDGWRGYIAPMKGQKQKAPTPGTGARTFEDRIISEHLEQETAEGIVGIATCRATSGHRPLHMACITKSSVGVCVDPHLYLSWYVQPLTSFHT
jgi:hypothetical protein